MHTRNTQNGSAHGLTAVVIVVIIISLLGFVFWKNYLNKDNGQMNSSTSREDKKPEKKSEIVIQENSDMNRYVNYDQKFEFEFPKEIFGSTACKQSSIVYDNYGNEVHVQDHYLVGEAKTGTTVLESGDRYIIASSNSAILSNNVKIDDGHTIALSCNEEKTTIDLVDYKNDINSEKYVSVEDRTFEVSTAQNDNDITAFIRKVTSDSQASIGSKAQIENGRQDITFKPGSDQVVGGYGYKLWYYPTPKKIVFIALGQNPSFKYPDNSDNWYLDRIVDSFKLRS